MNASEPLCSTLVPVLGYVTRINSADSARKFVTKSAYLKEIES